MSFSYILSSYYPIPDKQLSSIIFDISRYGKHTHRIDFGKPVSYTEAVEEVERFLSVPLDDEYYNLVKDDVFHNIRPHFDTRGDCLTDLRFLEKLREIEPGVVRIECGS
jgi:hypothetical protein